MAGRPRHAPHVGELLLPSLRNPARCSENNQREADAGAQWDDSRHRRARRRRPREPQLPVAYVVLPPVFPIDKRRRRRHRSDRRRAIKKRHSLRYSSSSDEQNTSSSDDEDSSGEGDNHIVRPPQATSMRSQRMRSIAAMSKLQHEAATTIQREYRFYRRRLAGRHRRNQRLARQAQDLLDVFLLQEVTNIVPTCLLDVLRETCMQEAATAKHRQELAASLGDGVLLSLIDGCIRDVFDDVLQAMVKSYFAQQIDLSRAATPPALAVAADILDDWTQELVAELLPEVLAELASKYTAQQQHEVLHSTGSDTIDTATLDPVTTLVPVAPATNQPIKSVCQSRPTVTTVPSPSSNMASPFVSSLRTSLGATGSSAVVSATPNSTAGKSVMMNLFSELDLALDASGAVVAGGKSAAKDLLASKSAEKQAEAELEASRALKRQQAKQQQSQEKKQQPVTALSQALGLFDQEVDERESFMSRATKRRQKGGKKTRGASSSTASRGRRQRQDKYKRV